MATAKSNPSPSLSTMQAPISLIEKASTIANTAEKLREMVRTQKKPITLTTDQLKAKLPGIAALGPNVPVIRLRLSRAGLVEGDTLGVWLGDDGKVGVFDPRLNPVAGVEILSWSALIKGSAIISIGGQSFEIGFNPSDEAIDRATNNLEDPTLAGEGNPPPDLVAPIPHPEIPPYSKELAENIVFEIKAVGRKSQKYQTPMIDIQSEKGEFFRDVICNAEMEKIASTYGVGGKFKIVGRAKRVNKEGLPIDSDGNVNREKPSWIVKIADLQGEDFSDLAI